MSDSQMNAPKMAVPNCFGKYPFRYPHLIAENCDSCLAADSCAIRTPQPPLEKPQSSLNKQVAGTHYKTLKIQPIEYIHANNLDFFEGNIIKYVTRWRGKNGIADLEKAKHYIELLIELESKNA